MHSTRRSEYDVTNTVLVSSAADVRDAVRELFAATWPDASFAAVAHAFHDFDLAFSGRMPGYYGVDTIYHDQQHTLDVTLAMARLMAGYELTHRDTPQALGAERGAVGLLLALFHDIGYLRAHGESASNGAEFTRNHVTRSAHFMDQYLPTIGFGHWTHITSQVVHFTGYERSFEQIGAVITDPRDIKLGHLLGTADMIAQMADRPDPGATVCSCFSIGINQIVAAIASGRAVTVAEIGEALKAGSNCGSCRPEIARILQSTTAIAAE